MCLPLVLYVVRLFLWCRVKGQIPRSAPTDVNLLAGRNLGLWQKRRRCEILMMGRRYPIFRLKFDQQKMYLDLANVYYPRPF